MNPKVTGQANDFGIRKEFPSIRYVDRQSTSEMMPEADKSFLPIMNPGKDNDLIAGKPVEFWTQVLLKAAEQNQQGSDPGFNFLPIGTIGDNGKPNLLPDLDGSNDPGFIGGNPLPILDGSNDPGFIGSKPLPILDGSNDPGFIGGKPLPILDGSNDPGFIGGKPLPILDGSNDPGFIGGKPLPILDGSNDPGFIGGKPLPILDGSNDPGFIGGKPLPILDGSNDPGLNFFHPIGKIGDDGMPIVDPGFNYHPIGKIGDNGKPNLLPDLDGSNDPRFGGEKPLPILDGSNDPGLNFFHPIGKIGDNGLPIADPDFNYHPIGKIGDNGKPNLLPDLDGSNDPRFGGEKPLPILDGSNDPGLNFFHPIGKIGDNGLPIADPGFNYHPIGKIGDNGKPNLLPDLDGSNDPRFGGEKPLPILDGSNDPGLNFFHPIGKIGDNGLPIADPGFNYHPIGKIGDIALTPNLDQYNHLLTMADGPAAETVDGPAIALGNNDHLVTKQEFQNLRGTLTDGSADSKLLDQLVNNYDAINTQMGDGTGLHTDTVAYPTTPGVLGAYLKPGSPELARLANLDSNPDLTDADFQQLSVLPKPEDIYLRTLLMADKPDNGQTAEGLPVTGGGNGDGIVTKEELASIGANLLLDGSPENMAAGRMAKDYDLLNQLGDGTGLHIVTTSNKVDGDPSVALPIQPETYSPELRKLATLDGDNILTENDWQQLEKDQQVTPFPIDNGLPTDKQTYLNALEFADGSYIPAELGSEPTSLGKQPDGTVTKEELQSALGKLTGDSPQITTLRQTTQKLLDNYDALDQLFDARSGLHLDLSTRPPGPDGLTIQSLMTVSPELDGLAGLDGFSNEISDVDWSRLNQKVSPFPPSDPVDLKIGPFYSAIGMPVGNFPPELTSNV